MPYTKPNIMTERFEQTETSQAKNVGFFLNQLDGYASNVGDIDTYQKISKALTIELAGIHHLLDIGNGGVFDYDTSVVGHVTGLDLFLDKLPADRVYPKNVNMERGDALGIPKGDQIYDGVVMVMLLHHLVGSSVAQCLANLERALQEAHRVLRSGGKLVIVESCVPSWFYQLERLVFRAAVPVINRFFIHPPAFQFTIGRIAGILEALFGAKPDIAHIPKGKYVLQLGLKVPSVLTPVQPYLIKIQKE